MNIMKYFKTFLMIISLVFLFYFINPNHLYAYLDAGSGSYVIQIIIAFVVGGAFGIKIFWRKIYSFFKNRSHKRNKYDKLDNQ